ncbi:RING finger protein 121-like protein [Umbelopsis sp. PMI_123]|nr:RING finger protein 121-like protein [Umbelopsis sp. PMI_123]
MDDHALMHGGELSDEDIARLTPEQLGRYKQQQDYLKEHKGHEAQHETMFLILLFALFASQFLILWWKKKHYRSYQAVSFAGLWLIPLASGLKLGWWRFIFFWILYSIVNGWIIHKSTRKPLEAMTPRLVYKWFTVVYNCSFVVGMSGYAIVMLTFFGIATLFVSGDTAMEIGIMFLSYGLYFGVLGRDLVEICSDRMAATIGYYSRDGLPNKHLRENICAICGSATRPGSSSLVDLPENGLVFDEPIHELECKHAFHEKCIRGWCLIGKKDICPYCKEKVDMKQFKKNPWDTQQQLYISLLDGVRYLVVWQPIIFGAVQVAYYILGLK